VPSCLEKAPAILLSGRRKTPMLSQRGSDAYLPNSLSAVGEEDDQRHQEPKGLIGYMDLNHWRISVKEWKRSLRPVSIRRYQDR